MEQGPSHVDRFKKSLSFYALLDYCSISELLQLQLLAKRFYDKIIPMKLFKFPFRTIDRQFILFDNDKLYCVDRSLTGWKQVPMKKEDKDVKFGMRWSKTIQVGKEVYFISGIDQQGNPTKKCLKFNVETHQVTQIRDINKERTAFGIVYLNLYIYAIGGVKQDTSVERYYIVDGTWSKYESLPHYQVACTAITFSNRLIYTIGGYNYHRIKETSKKFIDIIRKDTYLDTAWEVLQVDCPTLGNVCQLGLLSLFEFNSNTHQILTFGGLQFDDNGRDLSNKMHLITIQEEEPGQKEQYEFSLDKIKVEQLQSTLKVSDRIYFNASYKFDQWKNVWAVFGRMAMHVFDLDKLECLESREDLNYVQLVPTEVEP